MHQPVESPPLRPPRAQRRRSKYTRDRNITAPGSYLLFCTWTLTTKKSYTPHIELVCLKMLQATIGRHRQPYLHNLFFTQHVGPLSLRCWGVRSRIDAAKAPCLIRSSSEFVSSPSKPTIILSLCRHHPESRCELHRSRACEMPARGALI